MAHKSPTLFIAALCAAALCQQLTAAEGSAAATPAKPAAPAKPAESRDRWVFSLLPKSFQTNPRIDITVITEVSDEGKKLPTPSPADPVYFESVAGGFRSMGAMRGTRPEQSTAEITRLLFKSLATSGYLPTSKGHPPTQLIVYTWGIHSLPDEPDPENPTVSANAMAANILDRAALVGGTKFANQLTTLFNQTNDQHMLQMKTQFDAASGMDQVNEIQGTNADFFNPVELFKRSNVDNEFLVDQASSDVYYVVASAYDYASVTANHRVLLWRTRMTAAAIGVSQTQSLPTVITAAAPYFGKDMPEPQILSKRSVRDGHAIIGDPTLVEPLERMPEPRKTK